MLCSRHSRACGGVRLPVHGPRRTWRGRDTDGSADDGQDDDGQAEKLKGAMTEEHTLDERPRTPETGNGIRYRFRKVLRLTAGNHKVFVAVPDDDVAVEVEIRLEDGTRSELVLEPVYATWKRFGKRGPNFYSYLTKIRLLMNGKLL